MDYYYKEFSKLQEEFHEVMHEYPLFSETIENLDKHDIKEINELLEKQDEFYLKQAITKLKDLISYVKETSNSIKNEYRKFDKLASTWEKLQLSNVSEKELDDMNNEVKKANELINSHDLNKIMEANKIMEKIIKKAE